MASRFGVLLTGLSWSYASQLSTVIAQFGYAAVTSRLVSAGGFGTYAVALTVAGFVSLLANGGLGQSVARMIDVDSRILGGLATFSAFLGLAGSTLLFASAELWSNLWGDSDAKFVIQILCIGLLVSPQIGLNLGLLRRHGRFRLIAIATFSSNIVGMITGLLLVMKFENAASLVASTVIAQLMMFFVCNVCTRGRLLRLRSIRSARSDIGFSANVILSSVLSYFASNLGKWSVSRWVGPSALGQWNRADVVTTVPFFQIQTAIVQVVYPEFRHDRENSERARRVWPDLLTLVAWGCWPAACFAAAVLPEIVPILFGPGWGVAADLSGPLVVISAVQVVTTVLGGAVESLGRFKWIWCSQLVMIGIQAIGVVFTVSTRSLVPAIACFGIVVVARQAGYVYLCHRARYLDGIVLLTNYLWVALGSIVAFGLGLIFAVAMSEPIWWVAATGILCVLSLVLIRWRGSLPPVRIVNRYRSMRTLT